MKEKRYFIKLRQAMVRYNLDMKDISKIINRSYRQTNKKFNKLAKFDVPEAGKVINYLKSLGDKEATIDDYFFVETFSNENDLIEEI